MNNLVTCGLAAMVLGLSVSAASADATFTLQDLSHNAANDNVLQMSKDQNALPSASFGMLSQKSIDSALISPEKTPRLSGFDAIKTTKAHQSAQARGPFNLESTTYSTSSRARLEREDLRTK